MTKREIVIVLYSLPWDFPCDYVKQTSFELAKKAKVILFNPIDFPSLKKLIFSREERGKWLNLLGKKNKIFHFPSLGYLPFRRFGLIEKANIFLNCLFFRFFYFTKYGLEKPIIWIFNCDISPVIRWLNWGKISVYDRVDQVSSLDQSINAKTEEMDSNLIREVDVVFVNSLRALKHVKEKNKKAYLVPCGCSLGLFSSANTIKPREIQSLRRPIIGFVGSFDHRIDFKLTYNLAKSNPSWNFVFVGGHFTDDWSQFKLVNYFGWLAKLEKLPNVHLLGRKPKEMMPDYIASFDVCLIPYDTSQEFVKGCNPMKLYEYLVMGKPVVSTPIDAVNQYEPTVRITDDALGFEKAIRECLKDNSTDSIKRRKKIALENSWEEKVERMWQVIL